MNKKVESVWLNSKDADLLFVELKSAVVSDKIARLKFVVDWAQGQRNTNHFEYDTDLNHALYLLGLCYEELGNFPEAAFYFKTAIEVWPQDIASYIAYSNVSEDLDKQIEILENGLKLFDDPGVHFNLSHAYGDKGDPLMALKHLREIPKDWPEYSRVLNDIEIMRRRIPESRL